MKRVASSISTKVGSRFWKRGFRLGVPGCWLGICASRFRTEAANVGSFYRTPSRAGCASSVATASTAAMTFSSSTT
ncbi:hypothetical protein [Bradyrhizobium sp. P5_C11_2]